MTSARKTRYVGRRGLAIRKPTFAGLSMILVLGLTGACSSGGGSKSNGGAGTTLTYANNIGPITMNPLQMGNGTAGVYAMPAYDSLLTIKPDGTLAPDLATKWGYVAGSNNSKFQLTLRPGVKFSDGTPMTAQSVVNSIEYALKNAYFKFTLGGVTSVTAPTSDTVLLSLSSPNPELPYAFDQYWQQGDIIGAAGLANPKLLLQETLGTGPYELSSSGTISGVQYTYVPNPYYWNKSAVHWQKIVIKVFEDTDSALQALESGQVQAAVGNVAIAEALGHNSDVTVLSDPVQEAGIVIEDQQGEVVPALGKVQVRQAMNYAINRTEVNQQLSGSLGDPLDQIQGKGFGGYDPSLANYYAYDVTKARQLLTAAGYPNGFAMTLLVQKGTQTDLLAQLFAGQMSEIGIKVAIRDDTDPSQFIADANTKKYPAVAPVLNMGTPYFTYQNDFGTVANLWNIFGVTYPDNDALVKQATAASGSAADKLWQQIWGSMAKNAVWVPMSQAPLVYFLSSSVKAESPNQQLALNPVDISPK